jgi:TolA-binding protein
MKRQLPALIAAFLVTAFIVLVMSVMSVNALFNKNSVDVSNSSTSAAGQVALSPEQAQIQQLQARINEYQQREQQYQSLLERNQQQVQQLTGQMQQFQQFLFIMQNRGLIRVQNDGSVVITGQPAN